MTDKQNYFTYIDNTSDDTNKTYKQTIMDGVDVSGCEFYNKDDKTCREVNGKYDTDICEFDKCENSNCYYKNWKRMEQECETQQKALELQKSFLDHSEWKLKRAEQKLEKIKEICKNVMPTGIDEETDKFGDILEIIEE